MFALGLCQSFKFILDSSGLLKLLGQEREDNQKSPRKIPGPCTNILMISYLT